MNDSRPTPKRLPLDSLACVYPNAAGLDIGAREIVAAVPPDRTTTPVRAFATFTPDLHQLVEWLIQSGIDTVAMESTGVYWVPIYELLEQNGIKPFLVNARHVKTVPGRKSDWNDAQWLQKLHALGLLQGSFRPDAEMCVLRTLLRHRAELIQHRAPHILHMQKALKLMNLQLPEVLTNIVGVTGQAILRAIVAGERDALQLARLRQPNCQSTTADIVKALTGDWREEQVFVLKQSLELFDYYTQKITECDHQIEQQFSTMKPRFDSTPPPATVPRVKRTQQKNQPNYDAQTYLLHLTGIDLTAVTGISGSSAQTILSEIGTDMSRWPTVKHFCSWLGLAPHNDISGGQVLHARTLKVGNRAAQALRQSVQSVARSDSAYGAYFRAMRARLGPQQAAVATAHKLARVIYHLLKYRDAFQAESAEEYERQRQDRELKYLKRRANKFGYQLMPVPEPAGVT